MFRQLLTIAGLAIVTSLAQDHLTCLRTDDILNPTNEPPMQGAPGKRGPKGEPGFGQKGESGEPGIGSKGEKGDSGNIETSLLDVLKGKKLPLFAAS